MPKPISLPQERVTEALAAADAVFHGIAHNIRTYVQDNLVVASDMDIHRTAAALIVQELLDHDIDTSVGYYDEPRDVDICSGCGWQFPDPDQLRCPACGQRRTT